MELQIKLYQYKVKYKTGLNATIMVDAGVTESMMLTLTSSF